MWPFFIYITTMSNETIIMTPDGGVLDVCWCADCYETRASFEEPADPTTYAWEKYWIEHSISCRCPTCIDADEIELESAYYDDF